MRFVHVLVAALAVSSVSCKKPQVTANFTPRYICSGEEVFFTWTTKNVDRITIKGTGEQRPTLLDTTVASGNASYKPVDKRMFPVIATGYQGDAERSFDLLFQSIDDPSWLAFEVPTILSHEERSAPRTAYIQTGSGSTDPQEQVEVTVVDVYKVYEGYRWDLEGTWFSDKAVYFRVKNSGSIVLRVSGPNFSEMEFPPGYERTAAEFFPAGQWVGRLPDNPNDPHRRVLIKTEKLRADNGQLIVEDKSNNLNAAVYEQKPTLALYVRCK